MSSTGCSCNSSNCQFTWAIGDSIIAQGDGSTALETYKYLYNLSAGTYSVIATDASGECNDTYIFNVTEPEPLNVVLDLEIPDGGGCAGDAEASITANVTGGSGNYDFIWTLSTGSENIQIQQKPYFKKYFFLS